MKQWINLSAIVITACVFLFQGCGKDDEKNGNKVPETGTVTDSNGNTYKTVKIGEQWWMAENLRVTNYSDGTTIPEVIDDQDWRTLTTDAMCWYNSSYIQYGVDYGGLYNWHAVHKGKLCPDGWHVPTDEEWQQLERYLGMSAEEAKGLGWRGTDEGGKLKASDTTYWHSSNPGSTNSTGFTALPGGYRNNYNGSFGFITGVGYYWTASSSNSNFAWYREFGFHENRIQRSYFDFKYGFSVRCVKD